MARAEADRRAPVSPTARRIEDAAVDLFFAHGFEATTMREIAVASRLTAGALYNHFVSKDQLLASILHRVHDVLERMLVEGAAAANGDAQGELVELVRAQALFHTRFRKEARVANSEIASLPEPDRSGIVEQRRRLRRMFEQAVERGRATHGFEVPDIAVTTAAILNMGIGIADWFRPDGRLSAEAVAELHADLALRMVGAKKEGR